MLSVPGSRLLLLGVMKGGTPGMAVSMSSLTNYPVNPAHSCSWTLSPTWSWRRPRRGHADQFKWWISVRSCVLETLKTPHFWGVGEEQMHRLIAKEKKDEWQPFGGLIYARWSSRGVSVCNFGWAEIKLKLFVVTWVARLCSCEIACWGVAEILSTEILCTEKQKNEYNESARQHGRQMWKMSVWSFRLCSDPTAVR